MTNVDTTTPAQCLSKRRADRPNIQLPDGEVLEPRANFARNSLGVTDKTAQKLNLPTLYIGNVAYVKRNASLQQIAARTKRRNEPPARHRARRGRVPSEAAVHTTSS